VKSAKQQTEAQQDNANHQTAESQQPQDKHLKQQTKSKTQTATSHKQ
jgi:hypothetical protein